MDDATQTTQILVTADNYVALAGRTACPLEPVRDRINAEPDKALALLHMVVGKAGELGELATAVEHWLFYGKDLDEVNIVEECGDDSWYTARGLGVLDVNLTTVLTLNIAKLYERYPRAYDGVCEAGRDTDAERQVLEATPTGLNVTLNIGGNSIGLVFGHSYDFTFNNGRPKIDAGMLDGIDGNGSLAVREFNGGPMVVQIPTIQTVIAHDA